GLVNFTAGDRRYSAGDFAGRDINHILLITAPNITLALCGIDFAFDSLAICGVRSAKQQEIKTLLVERQLRKLNVRFANAFPMSTRLGDLAILHERIDTAGFHRPKNRFPFLQEKRIAGLVRTKECVREFKFRAAFRKFSKLLIDLREDFTTAGFKPLK